MLDLFAILWLPVAIALMAVTFVFALSSAAPAQVSASSVEADRSKV